MTREYRTFNNLRAMTDWVEEHIVEEHQAKAIQDGVEYEILNGGLYLLFIKNYKLIKKSNISKLVTVLIILMFALLVIGGITMNTYCLIAVLVIGLYTGYLCNKHCI